jgi:hypothetical protein
VVKIFINELAANAPPAVDYIILDGGSKLLTHGIRI